MKTENLCQVINILKKPPVYTKSASKFWDDEYISKQMLKAHLDPEFEAATRKLDFIDKSIEWIKNLCPPAETPRLLDIGCGPGIYAERFTGAGYQVTGVDFSKRSIEYAKQSAAEKNLSITYHYQNYLEMNLQEQFELVTLIYCDDGALSTQDRETVMKKAYEHLKPGGKFLFDVFTVSSYQKREEHKDWTISPGNGFWREEECVEINGSYLYENYVSLDMTTIITEQEITPYYIWDTCFSKESLAGEAEAAGFRVCAYFGDIAGAPYSEENDTMAILLQK